jgi:hypothetical protein
MWSGLVDVEQLVTDGNVDPEGCRLKIRGDSTLVVDDALGTSYIRKFSIKLLSAEVHAALLRLRALGVSFGIEHIGRANNKVADALAKAAAEGLPQRGDAPIPGVDVGQNPRVHERTWRWQLNGKQRDVTPFTVSGARQLLQARTWPETASGKQTTINPTRWTPPEWPVTRPTLSGRMWAMTWRNMCSNKNCPRENTVMWRLAHGALPLPPHRPRETRVPVLPKWMGIDRPPLPMPGHCRSTTLDTSPTELM